MRRVAFNGKLGANASFISSEPVQIFEHLFADELIEHKAHDTNLPAGQRIEENQREGKLKRGYHENSWQPTFSNKIRLYVVVFICCGLIWKPSVHMYFSKNSLFAIPGAAATTPQQRFILIEKYLHLLDNTALTPEHNCRAKIASVFYYVVIIYLKEMFPLRSLYCCGRDAYLQNNTYHVNTLVLD